MGANRAVSIPTDQLFPGFKTPPNDPSREVKRAPDPMEEEPVIDDDFDDPDFDDEDTCECCGGDGVIEYAEHPEVWGEDNPSYQNHLLPCPECSGRGF